MPSCLEKPGLVYEFPSPVARAVRPCRQPAMKRRPLPTATKWRHALAMDASPWNRMYRCDVSPAGTTGIVARSIPAAPSGLGTYFVLPNHGLAPVANPCRPCGTQTENTLSLLMHTGWCRNRSSGDSTKGQPKCIDSRRLVEYRFPRQAKIDKSGE